ncbi:hypothetical protein GGTG_08672 [Gaeumannomyces tritici R3-111a-1]|uniref:Uncharacterized protein n=1 Tax=Gaeumannomyces tritici (strain R3-111a-1) TaxID=644352 RepID=J3P583_GAET3|nr:hypothetical protein GGTG_08672 [Gaeumannomyces tritici R3-111a-1]EJT74834.1 hypothetical protein GGTG_08672 [Gaeumannomyces tritici R3-111a-1]
MAAPVLPSGLLDIAGLIKAVCENKTDGAVVMALRARVHFLARMQEHAAGEPQALKRVSEEMLLGRVGGFELSIPAREQEG